MIATMTTVFRSTTGLVEMVRSEGKKGGGGVRSEGKDGGDVIVRCCECNALFNYLIILLDDMVYVYILCDL